MTTRRFALSKAEYVTTATAAVVSSTSYVIGGLPYLSRGVVGDLTGFLLLGAAGAAAGARVQHEAAVCLVLIGGVIALNPEWPLRVSEPRWWALFTTGLAAYVLVRRRSCDWVATPQPFRSQARSRDLRPMSAHPYGSTV